MASEVWKYDRWQPLRLVVALVANMGFGQMYADGVPDTLGWWQLAMPTFVGGSMLTMIIIRFDGIREGMDLWRDLKTIKANRQDRGSYGDLGGNRGQW